jgi:outer membrane biosynthesis protein TonB
MNLNAIKSAIKVGGVGALLLAATTVTFRAKADEWDKRTVITIDQPIQVTKTVLQPGTYVFRLLDSPSNRNIVEIYNADQTHLITTVLAINNYRLQPTGNSKFLFYETPEGSPKAVRAWFYPGDEYGQEFPYPQHLATLTASTATPAPPAPAPAPAPAPEPAAPQAQAPPPPQQAQVETQTQVEVAQNNPPPPPAVDQPAPAPEPAPASLPKTATPYPLFGMGGLLSLAAYGLLRLKRAA